MHESTPATAKRTFPGATLMVVGAARCGTSSIHELFRLHPAVCASNPKEPFFFENEYERGLDYYRQAYFPHWNGQHVVVEARVANMVLPFVTPRIKNTFPDAQFVVSLREPAERAFSHWALKHSVGLERRPFGVAIAQARERLREGNELEGPDGERLWRAAIRDRPPHVARDVYLEAGLYATHMKRFFAHFPRERLFVLSMEELRADTSDIPRRLFQFAGLDPALGPARMPRINRHSEVGSRFLHRINNKVTLHRFLPSSWRQRIRAWTSPLQPGLEPPASVMASLREFYAPHDRDLCQLMGWTRCPWEKGRS